MTVRKTSYHQIVDDFKLKISNLDLLAHDAFPSEKELSEKYSVSRSTVRKALNLLEDDNLIYRKPGIGTFVQDSTHSSCIQGKLDVYIDLPFHISGAAYYNSLFANAQDAVAENSACQLLPLNNRLFELEENAKALLITHAHVDDYPKLETIAKKIPVILFNRLNAPSQLSVVAVDYRQASFDIINRFIKNGCTKIMLIGDSLDTKNYTSFERGCGYRQAFSQNKLNVDENAVVTLEESYELSNIINKIKSSKPDVIYISSEDLISDTLMAIELTRKEMDKEVLIFCFDDVTLNPRLSRYNISCFRLPLAQMCQCVFQYITNYYNGGSRKPMKDLFHVQTIINRNSFLI